MLLSFFERIHACSSMRPSSEPTADPEPEPSADLQWLNARMPIYIPWLAILIRGISSSKVCDWEKQICRIIDHAPRSKHTILCHLISISDSLALMMMLWLNWQVVLLMSGSSSSVSEEFTIFAIFRSPSCSIDDLDLYDSEINDTITGSFTNALSNYNKLNVFDLGECYLSKLEGNKYHKLLQSPESATWSVYPWRVTTSNQCAYQQKQTTRAGPKRKFTIRHKGVQSCVSEGQHNQLWKHILSSLWLWWQLIGFIAHALANTGGWKNFYLIIWMLTLPTRDFLNLLKHCLVSRKHPLITHSRKSILTMRRAQCISPCGFKECSELCCESIEQTMRAKQHDSRSPGNILVEVASTCIPSLK